MIWRVLEPTVSPTFEMLADVIGVPSTRNLIAGRPLTGSRGRRFVYVPKARKLTADHHLVKSIGMSAATDLCNAFSGEILELPRLVDRAVERRTIVFGLWARGTRDPVAIWRLMTNNGAEPWASRFRYDSIRRDVEVFEAIAAGR